MGRAIGKGCSLSAGVGSVAGGKPGTPEGRRAPTRPCEDQATDGIEEGKAKRRRAGGELLDAPRLTAITPPPEFSVLGVCSLNLYELGFCHFCHESCTMGRGQLTMTLRRRPGLVGCAAPLPPHPARRTLMKQKWGRSPEEHTRCLHPFLAT